MLKKWGILASIILTVSLISVTSLAYATTDNMSAKVESFKVVDKGTYNVLFVDLLFTAPNIEMGDWIMIYNTELYIVNEKGKEYHLDTSECKMPPNNAFQMTGKDGPTKVFHLCFSVEKQFTTFKVYYKPQYKTPIQIGFIDLNAETKKPVSNEGNPCARIMTEEEKAANPNRIQDGIPGIMHNGECVTDKAKLVELQAESKDKSKSDIPQIDFSKIQQFDIGKFFSDLLEQIKSLFYF